MRSFFLASLLFLCFTSSVSAINWTGGIGDWEDPNNWSTNTLPGPNDVVYINSGKVSMNSTATVNQVRLSSGAYLTIEAGGHLYCLSDNTGMNMRVNGGKLTVRGNLYCSKIITGNVTYGFYITNGGIANIESSGTLIVSDLEANAIHIRPNSYLANYGNIVVEDITDHHGIHNWGIMQNKGLITVREIDFNNAIENGPGAHWLNYGDLDIEQVSGNALLNAGRFVNTQDININDCALMGISSLGRFYNYTWGEINIEADNGPSFFSWDSGETYNYGEINSLPGSAGTGLRNDGVFYNYHNGMIHTDDQNGESGVSNSSSAEWYNYGSIIVQSSASPGNGLFNFGDLTNYNSGSIEVNGDHTSAINNGGQFNNYGDIQSTTLSGQSFKSSGDFTNHPGGVVTLDRTNANPFNFSAILINSSGALNNNGGLIVSTISDNTNAGLTNRGEIVNQNCGDIHLEGKIDNESNGDITNNAWLYSDHQGQHVNDGTILNNGVIEDLHGAFQGVSLINNGLIVGPLPNPTFAPSQVSNVFDLDPGAPIVVDDLWVEDCAGNGDKSAYYDQNSNDLDIYEYAIGLTVFQFNVTFDGCTRCIRMEVPGGAQYPPSPFAANPNGPAPTNRLRISPNPSAGFVQVEWPVQFMDQTVEWQVYNLQGQQLAAGQWAEAGPTSLQLGQLPNGTYLLRVSAQDQLIGTERMLIQR